MTPKEKAIELISDMCKDDCTIKNINKNKKLSKLVCDNIITGYKNYLDYLNADVSLYWKEVRKEIKNL